MAQAADSDQIVKQIIDELLDAIENRVVSIEHNKSTTENESKQDDSVFEIPNTEQLSNISSSPAATTTTHTPTSSHSRVNKEPLFYNLKWIKFHGKQLPIVLQNENGPCPLISLCNVLLLRQDLKLTPNQEVISNEKLVESLADSLFNHFLPMRASRQASGGNNIEIILNDTLSVIQKLQYGMDVNVKFSSCTSFEYTPELDMFDLYFVNLYHGWLIDPEQTEMYEKLAEKSYNQLIEMMISSDDFSKLLADSFLDSTASQMTYHGLASLHAVIKADELAVLFRNNHFSTVYKNPNTNQLYLLVTDNGFLTHEDIIWETLDNIDNDGRFCNSNFVEIGNTATATTASRVETRSSVPDQKADTTNDYLLALSLQEQMYENEREGSNRPQQPSQQPRVHSARHISPNSSVSHASSRDHRPSTSRSSKPKDKCLLM